MAVSLGRFARPTTVTILAQDPASFGKLLAFVLQRIPLPGKKHVSLDLAHNGAASKRFTPTRNPVERAVADNVRPEPETLTLSGSISATPLGLAAPLGAFGSLIRRDLRLVKQLRDLFDRREPLVVVTPWRTYSSMGGTSIDETHVGSNKVDLLLTFDEVRIVDTTLITGLLDLDEALAGAAATEAMGGQATELVDAPVGVAGGLG